MITVEVPKTVSEKISKNYQKQLEEDNHKLRLKVIRAKDYMEQALREVGNEEMYDAEATLEHGLEYLSAVEEEGDG